MALKIGELAAQAGVTVRALHHYDSIGLLRPSGRSAGGYRLYRAEDLARLHGIQSLRQLGVPLAEVARLLDGSAPSLDAVLAQQIDLLDRQIARAQALRERLGAIRMALASGRKTDIGDRLASLALIGAYNRYFSPAELHWAASRWQPIEADWKVLVQAIRTAMDRSVPAAAVETQALALQWIDLATRWLDGDTRFLGRWGTMLREQPGLPLPVGMDLGLITYIEEAIGQRLAVLARYLSPQQQQRLASLRPEWRVLAERGKRLMTAGVPPQSTDARGFAHEWEALRRRTVDGDMALWDRLVAAYDSEPLLKVGQPFGPAMRRYVDLAAAA